MIFLIGPLTLRKGLSLLLLVCPAFWPWYVPLIHPCIELAHEPDKSLTENEADKPLSDQASLIDNLSLNNHDDTASDAKAGSSADSTMETSTEETTDAVSKENSDACAEESSQPESLN